MERNTRANAIIVDLVCSRCFVGVMHRIPDSEKLHKCNQCSFTMRVEGPEYPRIKLQPIPEGQPCLGC